MKPPHNISIDFLDVGASVQVGCKRLAYTDLQQMLIDLSAYVNDPEATIKVMQEQHEGLREVKTRNPFREACEDVAGMAAQGLTGYPYPPQN